MDKVTICDHTFLEHTKSASIGGGNIGVGPTHFEWEYADAHTARFVTDGDIKHARGRGQIAWLLEPYELHPENYEEAVSKDFDVILAHSHIQQFDAFLYPFGGSWIPFKDWGMKEKTKLISMIISDKDTMPGHKLRRQVAEELGNKIDIWSNFDNKYDALAPYSYSIVIESEKSPYYFTEKLIDCMCVGTIPIYWGSPIEHFNKNGVVQVDSFIEIELAVMAIKRGELHYNGEAVLDNIERSQQYAICEDWIYEHYSELFQ